MGATGPFIAPLPTATGSPADDYANKINAAITELRTGLTTGITEADFQLQGELSAAGFPVNDVALVKLVSSVPGPGATTTSIYVKNGDWYITDGSGNEIALSAAGTLPGIPAVDLYGSQEVRFPIRDFSIISGTVGNTHNGYTRIEVTSSSQLVWGPLPLRIGERLTGFRIRHQKNATATTTFGVQTSTDGGGFSAVGGTVTSATSGIGTLTHTLSAAQTAAYSVKHYIVGSMPQSGDFVFDIVYTRDKIV